MGWKGYVKQPAWKPSLSPLRGEAAGSMANSKMAIRLRQTPTRQDGQGVQKSR